MRCASRRPDIHRDEFLLGVVRYAPETVVAAVLEHQGYGSREARKANSLFPLWRRFSTVTRGRRSEFRLGSREPHQEVLPVHAPAAAYGAGVR